MSHTYDSIQVGDSFRWSTTLTQGDFQGFADLTGDDNPIHLDSEYSAKMRFERPIAHGTYLLGLFSKVLGHDFPGPGSIAVSLASRFLRPVYAGDQLDIEVTVTAKIGQRRHLKMRLHAYVGGKLVAGGDCVVVPPER